MRISRLPVPLARLARLARLAHLALLALLAIGCKKEGAGSGVAALLSADAARKLPRETLAFVETLPADTQAFGYLDIGTSIEELPKLAPSVRPALDDVLAMVKRRWSVDPSKLRGAGWLVRADKALLVLAVTLPKDKPTIELDANLKASALGSLTVIGAPAQVDALLAARSKQKPLYRQDPAWVKSALLAGADAVAFFSASATNIAKTSAADDEPDPPWVENIEHATMTMARSGLGVRFTCKPSTAGGVRKELDGLLAMGRSKLDQLAASLPATGPGPMARALLGHYSAALFSSVRIDAGGDVVSATLGWRAPELPASVESPPLGERLIAPGEWAVAQVNLGAPMFEVLVAMTDVLGARLDRKAVVKELEGSVGAMLGVAGLDPSSLTVSAGSDVLLASLHTAHQGLGAEPAPLAGGALAALAQPWGIGVTEAAQADVLGAAAASPGAPLALLASSKLAARKGAIARFFVDATRLPPALVPPVPMPVQSAELVLTSSSLTAEVVAAPGQAQALLGPLEQIKAALTLQVQNTYDSRQSLPVEGELAAILGYHQVKQLAALFTPKVEGDRLRFSQDFPPMQTQLLGGAALVGVLAAVAVPAFMSYDARARAVGGELPAPADADPDQAPAPPAPGIAPGEPTPGAPAPR